MTTWEICYECDGERHVEVVEDAGYGGALTRAQLDEIEQGLQGETDDVIRLLWWRPWGPAPSHLRIVSD